MSWHGTKGNPAWPQPSLVAASNQANRADQGNNILANEYLDPPDVLLAKVKQMANMVRRAKLCCAYTGAGLSRSSGIPDYASKANNSVVNSVPKLENSLDALPTYAHCALTAMEQAGFLHHYVQQNHDGLPQKSGFPQEKINEIHGAWFDPSNPVVPFSGSLRGDLFNWMVDFEKKIDLCLCLGTSLSGMNADRCAETPAKRAQVDPSVLGTIIINIQQTRLDGICSLRIWGKLDEVFTLLGQELGLGKIEPRFSFDCGNDVFWIPYNETGKLDRSCNMRLLLRSGSLVTIPNQKAINFGAKGVVHGHNENRWAYLIRLTETKDGHERFVSRMLGDWMIRALQEGKLSVLPIMNIDPLVTKVLPPPSPVAQPAPQPLIAPAPPTQIVVVQSHEFVPRELEQMNKHKWSLSIDPTSCPMVEKVQWGLHPSFSPPTVDCTEAPFEIKRIGWGTFTVDVEILLKPEYGAHKLKAVHELTFNGGGSNVKTTFIPVN
jgi:NAD-dependent SIR2 family protein deacetylase